MIELCCEEINENMVKMMCFMMIMGFSLLPLMFVACKMMYFDCFVLYLGVGKLRRLKFTRLKL